MDVCRQIARVRVDWAMECERLIDTFAQRQGGRALSKQEKDEFIMDQFLFADIRASCEPCLPDNFAQLDRVKIQGRLYLQIVDITNIAANYEQRREDTSNRMLKVCLTDGQQIVYAIEFSPLRGLSTQTPSGTKVIVEQAEVRQGLLLLKSIDILGSSCNPTLEDISTAQILEKKENKAANNVTELIDLDLSDEERETNPAIRHLFYSPSTKMPPKNVRKLFEQAVPRPKAEAPQYTAPPPPSIERRLPQQNTRTPSNPNFPFTYLSAVEAQLTTSASVKVYQFKAFVKSVSAFAYTNGYDLKIYIEDGTRTLLVSVAPQYVEELMGVSCATFKHAMQVDLAKGSAWVQTMQLRLQALEGIMTVRFQPSAMPQLQKCEDFTVITAKALRERLLR